MNKKNSNKSIHVLVTPIGSLNDISLSVLEKLKTLEYIYCEDTRVTLKIIKRFKLIPLNKLRILNDINEEKKINEIINLINKGHNVGLISDAGHPIICDPGFKLLQECNSHNIKTCIYGSNSALLAGLIISNFDSNQFFFKGYLRFSSQSNAIKQLKEALNIGYTSIFFISKHDLKRLDMVFSSYFPNNLFCLIREISKKYQATYKGLGKEIIKNISDCEKKGEFVLVIKKVEKKKGSLTEMSKKIIELVNSKNLTKKSIAKRVSLITNDSANLIYNHLIKYNNSTPKKK